MARSPAGEPVLVRAARLLEAFEHDRQVLTVAQLARRAGLPVPTAHRLVGQLVDVGFLERDGAGGVRVGMRLWEIAVRAPGALDLREAAMPYLEDLHAATQQHTQLNVLDGLEVLVIERLRAHDALGHILLSAGRRIPAHAVASGLVLLAHADRELQEQVLAAPLRSYNPRTPIDPRRLRELWAAIRQQGYVVCDGFVDPRALSVSVPVRGPDDTVVAALGVVVPSAGATPMTHVPVLLAAARGIGRALRTPRVPGPTRMITYPPAAAPEA